VTKTLFILYSEPGKYGKYEMEGKQNQKNHTPEWECRCNGLGIEVWCDKIEWFSGCAGVFVGIPAFCSAVEHFSFVACRKRRKEDLLVCYTLFV
jgi:hypothetical protein